MKLSSVNRLRALVTSAKKTPAAVQTIQASDLPEQSTVRGEEGATSVLVDVKYSTINYKGKNQKITMLNQMTIGKKHPTLLINEFRRLGGNG